MRCVACQLQMRVLATRCRNGGTFRRCVCPKCDLRVWVKVEITETMIGTPAPKPAWSTNIKKQPKAKQPAGPVQLKPTHKPTAQPKPHRPDRRPDRRLEPEPIIDETEYIDADDLRVFGIGRWRE